MSEGTILALNEVNSVVLLAVARRYASATGAEAVTLETLGRARIVADDWGLKTGLALLALGSLLYGILFVSSGAVPPLLAWWGLVAGLLAVVGTWSALFIADVPMVLRTVSFVPIILFELVFGIWLLFWGGQIGASSLSRRFRICAERTVADSQPEIPQTRVSGTQTRSGIPPSGKSGPEQQLVILPPT